MSSARPARGRLFVLAVLGAAIAAVLAYRRRALARNADEFHRRYG